MSNDGPDDDEMDELLKLLQQVRPEAPRTAPTSFDPTATKQFATIELWYIKKFPEHGCETLRGVIVGGHPEIEPGRGVRTSALVWIDARIGWARTVNRFYKLARSRSQALNDLSAH